MSLRHPVLCTFPFTLLSTFLFPLASCFPAHSLHITLHTSLPSHFPAHYSAHFHITLHISLASCFVLLHISLHITPHISPASCLVLPCIVPCKHLCTFLRTKSSLESIGCRTRPLETNGYRPRLTQIGEHRKIILFGVNGTKQTK